MAFHPKKFSSSRGWSWGKNFKDLSEELQIAQPTAEVYAIDCLAVGRDADHQKVAEHMQISGESFQIIKNEILQSDKIGSTFVTGTSHKWIDAYKLLVLQCLNLFFLLINRDILYTRIKVASD